MRLNIRPFGIEQFLDTVDSDLFALVYHFATSVVAFPGIPLGVFVGQARTHCLHDLIADKVFRGNQFNTFSLSLILFFNDVENNVVSFHIVLCIKSFYHKYPIEMLNSLTALDSFT